MNLIFQYSPWFILLCLLLGAFYAFVLYRKDRRLVEFSKLTIALIASLRFLSASLLAFLLLSPLIKYISRDIAEPIIIIAQDNSASMIQSADSAVVKNELSSALADLKTQLGADYQIEDYLFGEDLRKNGGEANYTDRYSNFESLFREVDSRYENRNVGAMLVVSDGIFNRGMNPLYLNQNSAYPIYSLAIGDTNQRKDLLISNLITNKIAFLGNQFPIKLEYRALIAKGAKSMAKIFHKGKLVASEEILIEEDNQYGSIDFLVSANQSGLQTYRVEITPIEGEVVLENNYQNIYIDILDSQQKILFLYDAPHPDIAAIKQSISSSENYKLELMNIKDFRGVIETYDLLILHNLLKRNIQGVESLIKDANQKDISILYFVNKLTEWDYLNSLGLPIRVENPQLNLNEVYPIYDDAFPLFQLEESQLNILNSYPPLKVPQANFKTNDRSYVLLRQKIGSVPTKSPLLAFGEREKQKIGVMLGEGLWKWRMDNYLRYQNHRNFDRLLAKMIQYLSVKSDKSYLRISHDKEIMENEKLRFDLQLFNKSYDPVNEADAFMIIRDEEGNEYNYQFNRSSKAYFLEIAGLNIGNYTYRAYAKYGQQSLEERGRFSVREIKAESVQLVADHNLLYQLSAKSNGKIYYDLNMDEIAKEIKSREDISSISYTSEEIEDIINLPWIFYILIVLLGVEWFIRKYNGAY